MLSAPFEAIRLWSMKCRWRHLSRTQIAANYTHLRHFNRRPIGEAPYVATLKKN